MKTLNFLVTQRIISSAVPIQCSMVLCSLEKEMREVFSFIFCPVFRFYCCHSSTITHFVVVVVVLVFFFFFTTIIELRSNYHFPYCFAVDAVPAAAATIECACVMLCCN